MNWDKTGFITVHFSCKNPVCPCKKMRCLVKARPSKMNVVVWMKQVVAVSVSARHRRASPKCGYNSCDIVLPVPEGSDFIGEDMGEESNKPLPPGFKMSQEKQKDKDT